MRWIICILLGGSLLAPFPSRAEPGFIAIDPADRFVIVYVALPQDIPETELQRMRSKLGERSGASLESWPAFRDNLKNHIESRIVKNDYPEVRIAEILSALLQKYPMTPFALTWNGGLAVTNNDRRHAQRTHQRFLSDPAAATRPSERAADPVHPANHAGPLLGR